MEEFLKEAIQNAKKDAVAKFIQEVEILAMKKMMKTGKIEGAHHTSMKEIYEKKYNI